MEKSEEYLEQIRDFLQTKASKLAASKGVDIAAIVKKLRARKEKQKHE